MDAALFSLRDLLGHLGRWLSNLSRAGEARRAASRQALEGVVQAVRLTSIYQRMLDSGKPDWAREEQLALRWTDAALALQALKLESLAKRCQIYGRYWADPGSQSDAFMAAAGVRLAQIETQALALLQALHDGR